MNRTTLALIGLMSVGVFGSLVHYGWTHRYGSTQTYEIREPNVLAVSFQPRTLRLDAGAAGDDVWRDVPDMEVRLIPQMSQRPWTTGLTPAVRIQAFHDGTDIYFRLTWQDDVPNEALAVDSFADGCAVAVPLDTVAPVRSIMMGFSSPVNIWHWQAHREAQAREEAQALRVTPSDYAYPFEDKETLPVSGMSGGGAVTDLLAQRVGSLTRKDRQFVTGRGHWNDGAWTVVLKRSLKTVDAEQDVQFAWGRCPASFAVWDGDQGDRGSRKSMSDWVVLDIQAMTGQSSMESPRRVGSYPTRSLNSYALGAWVETPPYGARPIFALASTALGQSRTVAAPQTESEPRVIDILAQRFKYTPHRISVRKGERLTLRLEALDVTHGLYLDGYGVDIKAQPGAVGKATFTADKSGRFTFRCSATCGEFHPYMVGFLDVTPNHRFALFAAATGVGFLVILALTLLGGRRKGGCDA